MGIGFRGYVLGSALAATACVTNAYWKRKQLYPTVIHLTSSKVYTVVLANVALATILTIANLFKRIFFGSFRANEVERVLERAWYGATETLLAITIFRDEFDFMFVMQFAVLFLTKMGHWFMQERIETLETGHEIRAPAALRMFALICSLTTFDAILTRTYALNVLEFGPSVKILFVFEFGILLLTVITTALKFLLFLWEQFVHHGRWELRAPLVIYLDLIVDLLHVIAHTSYTAVILHLYGLPLHTVRDLYFTITTFWQRCSDLIKYRAAVQRLKTRFRDVTPEELAQMQDDKCAICFEHMTNSAKRLPCGHCFHFGCLRSWLEQRQVCPVCNADVLDDSVTPVGGTFASNATPAQTPAQTPAPIPDQTPADSQQQQQTPPPPTTTTPQSLPQQQSVTDTPSHQSVADAEARRRDLMQAALARMSSMTSTSEDTSTQQQPQSSQQPQPPQPSQQQPQAQQTPNVFASQPPMWNILPQQTPVPTTQLPGVFPTAFPLSPTAQFSAPASMDAHQMYLHAYYTAYIQALTATTLQLNMQTLRQRANTPQEPTQPTQSPPSN